MGNYFILVLTFFKQNKLYLILCIQAVFKVTPAPEILKEVNTKFKFIWLFYRVPNRHHRENGSLELFDLLESTNYHNSKNFGTLVPRLSICFDRYVILCYIFQFSAMIGYLSFVFILLFKLVNILSIKLIYCFKYLNCIQVYATIIKYT
jgi:hypothetical protein